MLPDFKHGVYNSEIFQKFEGYAFISNDFKISENFHGFFKEVVRNLNNRKTPSIHLSKLIEFDIIF